MPELKFFRDYLTLIEKMIRINQILIDFFYLGNRIRQSIF